MFYKIIYRFMLRVGVNLVRERKNDPNNRERGRSYICESFDKLRHFLNYIHHISNLSQYTFLKATFFKLKQHYIAVSKEMQLFLW